MTVTVYLFMLVREHVLECDDYPLADVFLDLVYFCFYTNGLNVNENNL